MNTLSAALTSTPVRESRELLQLESMDGWVRQLATRVGAAETAYPVLISREVLAQAEYDRAFPHLLMAASSARNADVEPGALFDPANLHTPEWCLSPAVCYHTYAHLAGEVIGEPRRVSARGKCFRNEDRQLAEGRRQIEFEMREIVLLGPPDWIESEIPFYQSAIEQMAQKWGFGGIWQTAEDPFFLPRARGKALMQRLLKVKQEFCLEDEERLALASINRHGPFFGDRFSISLPDGSPVHTACVAFGLDRWAAAAGPQEFT